jgi:hypothetical protein
MGEQQTDLFGDVLPPSPPPRSAGISELALTAQPGRKLSNTEAEFNRLVTKVEKLRAKMSAETKRLDAALGKFASDIHPRLQRIAALRADIVRALAPFLRDRRIKGVREKRALREFLGHQLDEFLADGRELPEELRAVYREVFREDADAADERDFELRREVMKDVFEEMGVDIDLSDLTPEMDEAEVAARVKEKMAAAGIEGPEDFREAKPRAATGARAKREQAREKVKAAAAELRQKTIGSIYKQLAKVLHPDLEQNPAERARKVTLMQELTVAHRAGDLHTLLRLEIEWLHRAEAGAAQLSDEKLKVFNTVLREQVEDLEAEIFHLPQHPRFQALVRGDGGFFDGRWTGAAAELDELDEAAAGMEESVAQLRGADAAALKEVKAILASWREVPF